MFLFIFVSNRSGALFTWQIIQLPQGELAAPTNDINRVFLCRFAQEGSRLFQRIYIQPTLVLLHINISDLPFIDRCGCKNSLCGIIIEWCKLLFFFSFKKITKINSEGWGRGACPVASFLHTPAVQSNQPKRWIEKWVDFPNISSFEFSKRTEMTKQLNFYSYFSQKDHSTKSHLCLCKNPTNKKRKGVWI
jgi:hypothetical protein